jgi:hypothetical protein
MGPYELIGSFYWHLQWAHMSLSAAFICSCNGPIHDYRQLSLAAVMGPFEIIGSISWQLQWCHRSAWTPLSVDSKREAQGLEEARTTIRT